MYSARYYREQAEKARRLAAAMLGSPEVVERLTQAAKDYDDIATDLETGAIEIRYPDRMPQQQHG